MTANVLFVNFRQPLRSDRYRVTSATRGEVRARALVEKIFEETAILQTRQDLKAYKKSLDSFNSIYAALPSKEVLEAYQQAVLERNVDPIFLTDDNGKGAA